MPPSTLSRLFAIALLAAAPVVGQTADALRLRIAVPEPHLGRIDVEVLVPRAPSGDVTFRFPEVLPGRLERDDPGAWIDDVTADADGESLPWRRTALGTLVVSRTTTGDVRLRYRRRVAAESLSVFEVDRLRVAFLGAAVFPSCDGVDGPVGVEASLPTPWAFTTSLAKDGAMRARGSTFAAVAEARFLLGVPESWTPDGISTTIHVTKDRPAPEVAAPFIDAVRRLIVVAEQRLKVPAPDSIAIALSADATSDVGVHASRTSLLLRRVGRWDDPATRTLVLRDVARGLASRALAPLAPRTASPQRTTSIFWFTEGAAEHLADLLVASLGDADTRFAADVAARLRDAAADPSAMRLSPARASELVFDRARRGREAPGCDIGRRGAPLALALDLLLRRASAKVGLFELVTLLAEGAGASGVDTRTLQAACDRLAPRAVPADFFARHIEAAEPIDLAPLLASVGFELVAPPDDASARLGVTLREATVVGFSGDSPLRNAGASEGDRIIGIGTSMLGEPGAETVEQVLARHRPGDVVTVTWRTPDGRVAQKAIRAVGAPPAWRVEVRLSLDADTARRRAALFGGDLP